MYRMHPSCGGHEQSVPDLALLDTSPYYFLAVCKIHSMTPIVGMQALMATESVGDVPAAASPTAEAVQFLVEVAALTRPSMLQTVDVEVLLGLQ